MQAFREQSLRFETRIFTEDVTAVEFAKRPFTVTSAERPVQAHAVIIATGATARRLHLPSEERLWNRGISACAVCDGALPIFRNKPLVVIGGGDSAVEEATYLAKFASNVYVVHRRAELRASKIMQQRLFANPKVEPVWNSVIVDVLGEQSVTGVRLEDVATHKQRDLACGGLFYAIGHEPNTAVFKGKIELAPDGYVVTKPGTTKTSVEGVFACGDVQDRFYRQAVTAAGSGCMAALDCERWLATQRID
jgi:thioredoxin reductase (NADPH)